MSKLLEQAIREWLRKERQGEDAQADRALAGVFSCLPAEPIPGGFVDQVMARLAWQPAVSPAPVRSFSWGSRAVLALSMVLTALFLLVVPSYIPALLGVFNLSRLTEIGIGFTADVSYQLGSGLVVWRVLTEAGEILAATLVSPSFLLMLTAALLLCLGAFSALHQVVLSERSSRYVGSV